MAKRAGKRWGTWRGTSREDVEQVAWVAMLGAPAYNPAKGDEEGYLWRIVCNACARHASCASNPLGVRVRADGAAEAPRYRGVEAVRERAERDEPFHQTDRTTDPEAETHCARWVATWVTRVNHLLEGAPAELVAVIVDEEKPAAVAARCAMEVTDLYAQVRDVRRWKLAPDPVLRRLRAQLSQCG